MRYRKQLLAVNKNGRKRLVFASAATLVITVAVLLIFGSSSNSIALKNSVTAQAPPDFSLSAVDVKPLATVGSLTGEAGSVEGGEAKAVEVTTETIAPPKNNTDKLVGLVERLEKINFSAPGYAVESDLSGSKVVVAGVDDNSADHLGIDDNAVKSDKQQEGVAPGFITGESVDGELLRRYAAEGKTVYTLQVAAFLSKAPAEQLKGKLVNLGYPVYIQPVEIKKRNWFRVRVGAFATKKAAKEYAGMIKGAVGTDSFIALVF